MNDLYVYISEYQSGQQFSGIVKSHNIRVNIDYHNDDPVAIEITNITRNHQELVGKTVVVKLTTENPIRGDFGGYVKNETDTILYFTS